MSKITTPGESIEGEKVLAYGRKIVSGGLPSRDKISGKLRFPIDIKRLGGASIEKCLNPKVAVFFPRSHLDVGDNLWGDMLEASSEKKFKADDILVGGARTSSHSGQSWLMNGSCWARIVKSWLKHTEAV